MQPVCREEEAASEVAEATRSVDKLRLQLARFNAAIGTANGLRLTLADDATTVEGHIANVLKVCCQCASECLCADRQAWSSGKADDRPYNLRQSVLLEIFSCSLLTVSEAFCSLC